MRNPFRYFNNSPAAIGRAVMLYVRYLLSLRQAHIRGSGSDGMGYPVNIVTAHGFVKYLATVWRDNRNGVCPTRRRSRDRHMRAVRRRASLQCFE